MRINIMEFAGIRILNAQGIRLISKSTLNVIVINIHNGQKMSDEKQTKKRVHKATTRNGASKHSNTPSFEATHDEGRRQSNWRDNFRKLCEFKVQFGHFLVPNRYSANPKLGKWVSTQRTLHRKNTEEKATSLTAERVRALDGIGFDWGKSNTDLESIWSMRFQQLSEFKVQFGHCLVPPHFAANPKLGWWVKNQRRTYGLHQAGKPSGITEERIRELESVGFDWGTAASIWSVSFQQLCEFKEQFGHCLVPQQYAANPKLGRWVSTQRETYRLHQEGKPSGMTEDRIRELESVGFDWEVRKPDAASIWSMRFQQLSEFKVQFGHCLVPQHFANNPKLGWWVKNQRRTYGLHQAGKPSGITEERIRELERVGFDWGTAASIWSVRIQEMREFKEQFGHCLVPREYAANPKLGRWVSTQRSKYRLHQEGKPSCLTTERIREVESIGFDWGTRKPDVAPIWSVRIQEMREFKEQFGHCLVPQQYADKHKLGQWVSKQRSNYRSHQEGNPTPMTEDRIRELESIGFDWGTRRIDVAPIWSVSFQQMREFKEQFGHCLVPQQYADKPKLGRWVSTQRQSYRLHQEGNPTPMTEDRIRELESIGFDWGTGKTDWASIWSVRIQEMREFKEQYGHCLVPVKYLANPKLRQWVLKQRKNCRLHQEGKPSPMTEKHIRELESVGFSCEN
jgi:hypothetical protein